MRSIVEEILDKFKSGAEIPDSLNSSMLGFSIEAKLRLYLFRYVKWEGDFKSAAVIVKF